jgi:hypothetical protein
LDELINIILKRENKKNLLKTALLENNLDIRDNLNLCNSFINDDSDKYNLTYIINIMLEKKWFINNTNYVIFFRSEMLNIYNTYTRDKRKEYCLTIARNKAIIEWIKNGKKDPQPPSSLNNLIEILDK